MLLGSLLRELKGKLQNTVSANAAHDRLLHHDLTFGALKHKAANGRVLALGVLTHHIKINLARGTACQG